MKAHIVVTTADGKTYEANVDLVTVGNAPKAASTRKNQIAAASHQPKQVDFELSIRNFVKTYGRSMSGPQRFALLVAYYTKGNSPR